MKEKKKSILKTLLPKNFQKKILFLLHLQVLKLKNLNNKIKLNYFNKIEEKE